MAFLDFLSGANQIGDAKGVDINKKDFEIQDADKLFGQTQSQFTQASKRSEALQPKQEEFLNALQQSAMGKGPSLAVETMKQLQDRSLQQQLAMASSQRGGNAALSQRNLMQAQAAGAQGIAQQGGILGLQEQQQNRQLYAQQLQAQQQQVDQLTQQYLSMGFNIRQAQEAAMADYNKLNVQQNLGISQINAQQQQARASATGQLIGGLIGAGAAMGGAALKGGGGAAVAAQPSSTGPLQVGSALPSGYGDFGQLTGRSFSSPTPPFVRQPAAPSQSTAPLNTSYTSQQTLPSDRWLFNKPE